MQVTKRSSWRQFVDSLDEPANQMSDILAWFNNASAGGQLQTATGGRVLQQTLCLTGLVELEGNRQGWLRLQLRVRAW